VLKGPDPRKDLRIALQRMQFLPGLFIGRVDGNSPAEYLTHERDRQHLRRVARRLLIKPGDHLASVRDAWNAELQGT
jgi:hypothetical protein